MTRERALWEAILTVAVPSLIIWGVVLYLVRANATAEEWPLYLIFVALPFPLIFPIYKRYLRGPSVKAENPRNLFIWAAVWAMLGSANVALAFFRPRDKYDLLGHLIIGIAWLGIGGEKFRRALQARPSIPTVNE